MFALLCVLFFGTCDGWGSGIHREITRIALREIGRNTATRKFLRDHLGDNDNIIRASSWADSDEAADAYPGSEDLHFSHTPWRKCGAFNMTRDCGFDGSGRCIVSGIVDFALVASDPSQQLPNRVDAIKFLIHFMGDIHQPLHTGFAEDNGGVNIQLATDPVLSLHQMWDYGIWESPEVAADEAPPNIDYEPSNISLNKTVSMESILVFASELATESSNHLTCNFAYQNEAGEFIRSKHTLSREYIQSRRALIASRINLAGERLADLFNALSASFEKNSGRPSRAAAVAPSPLPTNMFTILPIEFEPDDYIESRAMVEEPVVAVTKAESRGKCVVHQPRISKKSSQEDEVVITPCEPLRIGHASLPNIVLVKRRERYIVTCKALVEGSRDYDPMYVHHFRVRFSKNRKRTDPIVFLADYACFGTGITQHEFLIILYHLSGNDVNSVPATPGSSITVFSQSRKDAIDYEPIRGEAVFRNIELQGTLRGWNPFYLSNPRPVIAYLHHLEQLHWEDQLAQHRWAAAHNKTIEEKWDYDFFTKLRDILVYRVGRLQVIINRNTLTDVNRVEMRFAIYGCIAKSRVNFEDGRPKALGEDPQFTTLIDVEIFDGYITERILKGLSSIVKKSAIPDPIFMVRPTFLDELSDVDSILYGKRLDRAENFLAIQGFYIFPNVVSRTVAYIEWSIMPTMIQPRNDTANL